MMLVYRSSNFYGCFKRDVAKIIPKLINFEPKQRRMVTAQEMVTGVKPNPNHPDLAPADYFLFSKLNLPIKGKHFATIEEIKEKS